MLIENFSAQFSEVKIASGVFFEDDRGSLKKSMHTKKINELMGQVNEVLCTTSKKNVIRGLHFQEQPHEISKFVTCVKGKILDVFVDLRKDSKNFGKFGSKILNENDKLALFVPEGFAHGFSTLSDESIVVYLQSGDFNLNYDRSINPLSIDVDWHIEKPIISDKDKNAINFVDYANLN